MQFEHYPTRRQAELREIELIRLLRPRYNVNRYPRPKGVAARKLRPRSVGTLHEQRIETVYRLRGQGLSWSAVAAHSGLRMHLVQRIGMELRKAGRIECGVPGQYVAAQKSPTIHRHDGPPEERT